MLQRGDIVVERLTAKRAIVIQVASPEEFTCRFGDGRLEDRYDFELEPVPSVFGSLLAFVASLFSATAPRERPTTPVGERPRPLLVRPAS